MKIRSVEIENNNGDIIIVKPCFLVINENESVCDFCYFKDECPDEISSVLFDWCRCQDNNYWVDVTREFKLKNIR